MSFETYCLCRAHKCVSKWSQYDASIVAPNEMHHISFEVQSLQSRIHAFWNLN